MVKKRGRPKTLKLLLGKLAHAVMLMTTMTKMTGSVAWAGECVLKIDPALTEITMYQTTETLPGYGHATLSTGFVEIEASTPTAIKYEILKGEPYA